VKKTMTAVMGVMTTELQIPQQVLLLLPVCRLLPWVQLGLDVVGGPTGPFSRDELVPVSIIRTGVFQKLC
jgi:hypothetical protein